MRDLGRKRAPLGREHRLDAHIDRACHVAQTRMCRPRGARLRRGRLRHHRKFGACGRGRSTLHSERLDAVAALVRIRALRRGCCGMAQACERGVDGLLLADEMGQRILLRFQFVRRRLEAVSGGNESAVQFVIGNLQIRDAVFILRLHRLIAAIFGGDDVILEDHVDARECHPAQEDQHQARKRCLQRRTEGEELHPAVAADVDLALGKNRVQPVPQPLGQRMHHRKVSILDVLAFDGLRILMGTIRTRP